MIQPDDGRGPILEAIAGATNNIRLTIYEITDLQSVSQSPAAPADSVVQALINKAQSGVTVRVIVDQNKYGTGSSSPQIKQTVDALRNAGAIVHLSSTAFCVTHQKTFVIDGPTTANPGLPGTAIIMSLNLMPGYFGGTRDYARDHEGPRSRTGGEPRLRFGFHARQSARRVQSTPIPQRRRTRRRMLPTRRP